MANAAKNQRPPFEESDFDDAEYYPHFAHVHGSPNLPPVEFKVEDIPDSASPEEIIRAAMEDRAIETSTLPDEAFGPVVIPSEKSLYGYKYALSNSETIRFSPKTFSLFDASIVSICGADAYAFNPRDELYSYYSPLRRNIAILRNYLMAIYPAREKLNQAMLRAMAEKLGNAMRSEAQPRSLMDQIKTLITNSAQKPDSNRFLALANTPDRGIAFMYDYLRQQQAAGDTHWKLLPLDETPFSASNIARYSDATRMGQIAAAFNLVARNLKSVDDMTPRDKEISVDHARDILKNLRIIVTGAQEEKQYDAMDPRNRDAQGMLNAALGFQGVLAGLSRLDPDVLNDPLIMEASHAITKISGRFKQEEQAMLKQENRAETTTQPQQQSPSRPKAKPEKEKQKSKESIEKLVFKFEAGISRAVEIRKARLARTKQASAVMEQVLSKQPALPKALTEGQTTMANPKIHQVSSNDPDLIEAVKKANEDRVIEQQKSNPTGQSLK